MLSNRSGKDATLKDIFQKPHVKKADLVTTSPPAESPLIALAEAGSQTADDAPVKRSFLEQLFGTLRKDLATFKQDITSDMKDLKEDCNELDQQVNAMDQAGGSQEEELEVHRRELLALKDKN
ncbi:hypothetical protein NDU88_003023 [Pleurodeles waltl]|uniref:Uncharacterized protein n=1 Tax=Pleurodeles waltl TaxID=8319 RepID=A0AAV7W0Z3_PLEWA|nr:hypothetical protein NDU88_003023 [Pleurodeles waltl]